MGREEQAREIMRWQNAENFLTAIGFIALCLFMFGVLVLVAVAVMNELSDWFDE